MAANISPGVYWREIDLSNYIPQLSSTQFGLVGTASKGPINTRTFIATVEDLVKTFGYPESDHMALYTAQQYLREGSQLWFVRVESEASPATTASLLLKDVDNFDVTVEAKDNGTFYNDLTVKVEHNSPQRVIVPKLGSDFIDTSGTGVGPWELDVDMGKLLQRGEVLISISGIRSLYDDSFGIINQRTSLTENFDGSTVDYETGILHLTTTTLPIADTPYELQVGQYKRFSLIVSQTIERKTYDIETWTRLSLDPNDAEDYYQTVLKGSLIIESIYKGTDPNNKADLDKVLATSIGTFAGGTDGLQDIDASDYIGTTLYDQDTGLKLFASADDVDINMIAIPAPNIQTNRYKAIVDQLLLLAEGRKDCVALIDPPKGLRPEQAVDWINGANEWENDNSINSSYAAVYYPWVKIYDEYNDQYQLIPPSGIASAAFAKTDRERDVWWAPAGPDQGKVRGIVGTERPLPLGTRDLLYENRINPVNDFVSTGILIWGQKTAQVEPTALDRLNVRRLMIYIEKVITTSMMPFVFQPNTETTWKRVVHLIQPYLDSMVGKEALYEGLVVCDSTTNTSDIIDKNEMVVNIFLKPTKIAERIQLNFVILNTGANVNEYVGKQF